MEEKKAEESVQREALKYCVLRISRNSQKKSDWDKFSSSIFILAEILCKRMGRNGSTLNNFVSIPQYDEINRNIDTVWVKGLSPDFTINPFQPMFHFYTPWKHQKNLRFSAVFWGYRSGTLVEHGLLSKFNQNNQHLLPWIHQKTGFLMISVEKKLTDSLIFA